MTIERGVSIHFGTDVSVRVTAGGTLRMAGTESWPVELTTSDPLITWQGVQLADSQGTDNLWEHVRIERAGSERWNGAAYSAAALFVDGSSTLALDAVSIVGSEAHGLVAHEDVDVTVTGSTFEANETPAYVHPDVAHGLGADTRFIDNVNGHVRVVFGNNDAVQRDQTWAALEVPYRIENRFYVEGALTLAPGTVVEFVQDASLRVREEGNLVAEGLADQPIVFRGASAGTRGFWQGISVEAGGTDDPLTYGASFDHCRVEDAGGVEWNGRPGSSAAVWLGGAGAALITNCTFDNNERYALWADEESRIDGFAANTFSGNGRVMFLHPDRVGELAGTSVISGNDEDRIHVVFGNNNRLTHDTIWRDLGVPYEIVVRFHVEADLVLDPGVILEFAQDAQLIVSDGGGSAASPGSLTAQGTSSDPVVLRGVTPDADGFWVGVRFESNTPDNLLIHTQVEDTGSDRWTGDPESDAAFFIADGASLTLEDVEIGPGGGYGVYLESSDSTLQCTGVTFSALEDGAIYDDDNSSVLPGC
ncbi:MAG: hypothetical protein KTR31_32775 [Myxococcales bacterium]|nr:hypothetical protein [Myxococcales bacterium]